MAKLPDAQVVSRLYVMGSEHIGTLLFRSLQRRGQQLEAVPHLYDRREARITIPTWLPIPTTYALLCWGGLGIEGQR